jgi:hypothetical protein
MLDTRFSVAKIENPLGLMILPHLGRQMPSRIGDTSAQSSSLYPRQALPTFSLNHTKETVMGEVIHQSHITITREKGPTRIAHIRGFDHPVYYGVHGGIKKFYRVDPEEEHAATLDHLVGAVGG